MTVVFISVSRCWRGRSMATVKLPSLPERKVIIWLVIIMWLSISITRLKSKSWWRSSKVKVWAKKRPRPERKLNHLWWKRRVKCWWSGKPMILKYVLCGKRWMTGYTQDLMRLTAWWELLSTRFTMSRKPTWKVRRKLWRAWRKVSSIAKRTVPYGPTWPEKDLTINCFSVPTELLFIWHRILVRPNCVLPIFPLTRWFTW